MLSFLWDLASFIVALGVLITVHEFGHFWVARRCGVRVERFSIGFGKALWRRTDKLGTEYVIALIPLGGYVKMLDERAEPVVPELRHHAFNNKSVGQRAAIIAAGPVANFIFAIFAYWLVFIIGVPGVRPVVGEIAANSIAAEAQIAPGTELKAVDGIETPDWDAVRLQLVDKIGDESTTITVAPFGSDQRRDVKLDLRHWAFEPDKEDPVSSLGIRPRGPQIEPVLENVQPNSAASKAGLQAGDRIVKVDGQPLTQWVTFVMLVRDNPGKSLALEIERQGSPLSLTLIPESKPGKGKAIGFAGSKQSANGITDIFIINRVACAHRHTEEGRTNGDTLKAFEMNIFHYEPFSTVYGGAAKQQRRYEQLFHRHRYYAFFLTNSHNREKSLKSASPINSTSRIEPMR